MSTSTASVEAAQRDRDKDLSSLIGDFKAPTVPALKRDLTLQLLEIGGDHFSDLVEMRDFEAIVIDDNLGSVGE